MLYRCSTSAKKSANFFRESGPVIPNWIPRSCILGSKLEVIGPFSRVKWQAEKRSVKMLQLSGRKNRRRCKWKMLAYMSGVILVLVILELDAEGLINLGE